MSRLDVRKTYKLYIGGAFPRSECGRTYEVHDAKGEFLANAALASRKDARDAVVGARKAFPGWSGATAYNRGQVLYRVAELLEGRRGAVRRRGRRAGEGLTARKAESSSTRPSTAGLVRRLGRQGHRRCSAAQTRSAARTSTSPSPSRPASWPSSRRRTRPCSASSRRIAPAITTGNTVVVLASADDGPLPAITLAEVLATSDVPGGVVNVLTGKVAEVAPWLASHMDVNAIDLTGAGLLATDLEVAAADNLKRVLRPPADPRRRLDRHPGLRRLRAFLETKTVWHPDRCLSHQLRDEHLARVKSALIAEAAGRAGTTDRGARRPVRRRRRTLAGLARQQQGRRHAAGCPRRPVLDVRRRLPGRRRRGAPAGRRASRAAIDVAAGRPRGRATRSRRWSS